MSPLKPPKVPSLPLLAPLIVGAALRSLSAVDPDQPPGTAAAYCGLR